MLRKKRIVAHNFLNIVNHAIQIPLRVHVLPRMENRSGSLSTNTAHYSLLVDIAILFKASKSSPVQKNTHPGICERAIG